MARLYDIDYDYLNDILYIAKKNAIIKRSLDFNDLIIDVDENGNIAGVELLDASKVFSIPKKYLKNIINGKLSTSYSRDGKVLYIAILLAIEIANQKKEIKYTDEIRLEKPIVSVI